MILKLKDVLKYRNSLVIVLEIVFYAICKKASNVSLHELNIWGQEHIEHVRILTTGIHVLTF